MGCLLKYRYQYDIKNLKVLCNYIDDKLMGYKSHVIDSKIVIENYSQ